LLAQNKSKKSGLNKKKSDLNLKNLIICLFFICFLNHDFSNPNMLKAEASIYL